MVVEERNDRPVERIQSCLDLVEETAVETVEIVVEAIVVQIMEEITEEITEVTTVDTIVDQAEAQNALAHQKPSITMDKHTETVEGNENGL